jgi:pimeloyl-ACP methyl ester carboxylesterase
MREPPASLLLIHGAGSGPWVFDEWESRFTGVDTFAIDLQEQLDVARASMSDYAGRVLVTARTMRQPVALCGWSMGGLVALQATERVRPHSLILLESSPPAEIQGFDDEVELREGTFDSEAVYGAFPAGMRSRPESHLARSERKRGISIPSISCPSLVVYGDDFPEERGQRIASFHGSDALAFPGRDHWQLVLDERVQDGIAQFLGLSP